MENGVVQTVTFFLLAVLIIGAAYFWVDRHQRLEGGEEHDENSKLSDPYEE